MARERDKMWGDVEKVVTKHVLDENPDDETLAEYLGKTVVRDYRVGSINGVNIRTSHTTEYTK